MSPMAIGWIVFALVFGSALLVMFAHRALPEQSAELLAGGDEFGQVLGVTVSERVCDHRDCRGAIAGGENHCAAGIFFLRSGERENRFQRGGLPNTGFSAGAAAQWHSSQWQ